MKPIYLLSLGILFFACIQTGEAQNQMPQRPPRQRASETTTENTPVLTERAKIKNELNSQAPAHVVWLREIYREIDLEKENNAALLYPTQPIGTRVNLFTLIFRLMADGKLTAYNYKEAGNEIYTEKEKVNFEDILKKYQILYSTQGSGTNVRYIVEDADNPSPEVTRYLIKEAWYFDEASGSFKSQVLSLCPILVRQDYDVDDVSHNALFWIPYENLRPYLSREMIMTSNYNNTLTYTIDDYFSKRMYTGDIVKTVNLKNESLAQQVGDNPEALKHAQDSIENQLKSFEKQLWVPKDTIPVVDKKGKKENTKSVRTGKAEKAEKAEKPKESKPEKSSSPTRSVRRR